MMTTDFVAVDNVQVHIDPMWVPSMNWLAGITGGVLTFVVILCAVVIAWCAVLIFASRTTRMRTKASPGTILVVLIAAVGLGSLSGIVAYGGDMLTTWRTRAPVYKTAEQEYFPRLTPDVFDPDHHKTVRPYDGSTSSGSSATGSVGTAGTSSTGQSSSSSTTATKKTGKKATKKEASKKTKSGKNKKKSSKSK